MMSSYNEMNHAALTKEQKVAHIMAALGREDLPQEQVELIQGWVVYSENTGEGDVLMDAILDRMFLKHTEPTDQTRESFARLSERLGLPGGGARSKDGAQMNGGARTKDGVRTKDGESVVRRVPMRRTLFRVAAVLVPIAVLLGGGALWYFTGRVGSDVPTVPVTVASTMVEAVRGELGVVTLPDGSTVRPVGESRVTVAENFADDRHVVLSGEAFFSVARDEARPFTVEAEGLTVTVLGTEFNMKAWAGESEREVSLVSGSVEITKGGESVTLAPMERYVHDEATGESEVESFTPEQIDRWRFGRVNIDNLTLEQALRAVGDFYGMEVVTEGSLPGNMGVTTVLTDDVTPGAALEAIRLINDAFEYSVRGDTIQIVGK